MQDTLARKLRVLRAELGITLQQAEELTGVTRETLGALEHGQRGAYTSTLQKIAEGYGVTVGELLEEREPTLAGKAEAPRTGLLGGWIEQALEEANFAHEVTRAKSSQQLADELHREKIKAADEQREVVKDLKKQRAPEGVILEARRDLAMLQAQATAAAFLSIEMWRGRDVSALDPREIVADVLQTQRELFTGKHAQSPTLTQDAEETG
jgi:transcriptional regulator with XRE-family HTH domain